jgi:hypothetical protein
MSGIDLDPSLRQAGITSGCERLPICEGLIRPSGIVVCCTSGSAALLNRDEGLSTGGTMLHRGDLVPHFDVTTLQGRIVEYSAIWQRRNLVLITLPGSASESLRTYVSQFAAEMPAFSVHETECVITRDSVAGIGCPGVVIADRWGEIVHVATGYDVADLPQFPEVLEWVAYLQSQCPECQGESK